MKRLMFKILSLSMLLVALSSFGIAADPKPIFSEDFSEGPSSLAKWRSKDKSLWTVTADGVLVGNNTTDAYGIGTGSPKFKQKNLRATFRFKMTDAKGVQFKLNYVGGGHIGRFIIQPNGFFFQANKNRPLEISEAKNFERMSVNVERNVWHAFDIELNGAKITGTLDRQKSKAYEYRHLDNEIGTFELAITGKSAMFDDVVILPLKEEGMQGSALPKGKSASQGRRGPSPSATESDPPASGRMSGKEPIARSRIGLPGKNAAWSKPLQPFFAANCNDCHGDGASEGNFELASLSDDLSDAENMRRWVLLFDRVNDGEMPPEDSDRPQEDLQNAFVKTLRSHLADAHAASREVVLRRLNRSEYENTINDLFGTNIALRNYLPEDASKHGFDNNGEGLTLSTELIEAYLQTADLVLDRAIGPKTEPEQISLTTSIREEVHDNMYNKWFKLLEADGGTVIYSSEYGAGSQMNLYRTKVEGTYRFRLHAKAWQSKQPVMMQIQTGVLTRSGNKRFMGFFSVPPEGRVVEFTDYMSPGESLYPRAFGTIRNISGFLQQGKRKIEAYEGPGLHIGRVEIEGPIDSWPPPSRKQLLGDVDLASATADDAKDIFERFLPRAFRRPIAPREVEAYTGKVRELMSNGRSFEDSLRWALRAALCSADFLFLEEPLIASSSLREGRTQRGEGQEARQNSPSPAVPRDPSERRVKSTGREINDLALASRLSFYLWSSMPDDELMQLAAEGRLRQPDVLREQTERMLQSEKAKALTKNFANQWLDLREIDATSPDTKLYPEFDEYLKQSMVTESESFFEYVLQNNLSVASFVDSDWLIINDRLAAHYGIDGVDGDEFRMVKLPADSVRGGLMTQASILKVTANGANTSPVTRGLWILERIKGIHPPPPPPNVPAVVPDVTGANTLRQLLDAHRNEVSCKSCHRIIDPPGFALESFDAIGGFRTMYRFQGSRKLLPVDSSGVSAQGEAFDDIQGYKELMLKELDQITHGLAEKLLTYATGRQLGFSDRENLQAIVDAARNERYAFRELIHQTVQNPIFRLP